MLTVPFAWRKRHALRIALTVVDGVVKSRVRTPTSRAVVSAELDGFNVHAGVVVHEGDRDGLERLCRYGSGSYPPLGLSWIVGRKRPAFLQTSISWVSSTLRVFATVAA